VNVRKAGESESLEKLAANSTSTNHKHFCILKKTQNDLRLYTIDETLPVETTERKDVPLQRRKKKEEKPLESETVEEEEVEEKEEESLKNHMREKKRKKCNEVLKIEKGKVVQGIEPLT